MITQRPAGARPQRARLRTALMIACAVGAAVVLAAGGLLVAAPRAHSTAVRATPAAASAGGASEARSANGMAHGAAAPDVSAGVGIRTFVPPGGIRTARDVRYAVGPDGAPVTLDVCSPVTEGTSRPAVLLIHGGGWVKGDKGTVGYHAVCEWLAAEGFVTFSADYTLGAQGSYPVAPAELRSAIGWIRQPQTTARYGVDPKRIGLVGGSAGGSLAALLATEGTGPTDGGTRVAALVDISGPVDLTAAGQLLGHPGPGLQSLELAYLGCTAFENCRQATGASAIAHVDSSDPPAFIQGSEFDFVPHEQGDAFASALRTAGVRTTLRVVPGRAHSIAQLDASTRTAVAAFLHRYLG